MRSNGGRVVTDEDEWELHPVLDDGDRSRLKRTCNDIVRETAHARKWPNFPADTVAIGANGMGDFLVLLPDSAGDTFSDIVYVWRHDDSAIEVAHVLDVWEK